jgi:type II secretory pathway component PulF
MFDKLRNYHVDYLLPTPGEGSIARRDSDAGQFHHREILVGQNEVEIVRYVRSLGGVPVTIKLIEQGGSSGRKVSADFKEQFLLAIYFSCSSMSASKAMESVIESSTGSVRAHLNQTLQIIKRGGSFIEAIEETNFFDESTEAILSAGERTGTLKEAISTAVEHTKSKARNNKLMLGMAMFTGIELFFAVTSLLANRYGMLPSLEKNLSPDYAPEKIAALKQAIHTGYLLNDIMIYLTAAGMIVGVTAFYAYFDKDRRFRKWVDDKVMMIPILGQTILHTAISNSFKIAASLVKGGAPLTVVMDMSEKSTRVPRVIDYWREAGRRSENGDAVAQAMSQSVLDNTDQLLISAHTDRAQLAHALLTIGERRSMLAEKYARNFGLMSFILTSAYTTIAVCISLYVMYIQNASMMNGMGSGGG